MSTTNVHISLVDRNSPRLVSVSSLTTKTLVSRPELEVIQQHLAPREKPLDENRAYGRQHDSSILLAINQP